MPLETIEVPSSKAAAYRNRPSLQLHWNRLATNQIAISSDLEALFIQVFVAQADQPYLYFLLKMTTRTSSHTSSRDTSLQYPTLHMLLATQPNDAQWKEIDDEHHDIVPITKKISSLTMFTKPFQLPTQPSGWYQFGSPTFSNFFKTKKKTSEIKTTATLTPDYWKDSRSHMEAWIRSVLVQAKKLQTSRKADITQRKLHFGELLGFTCFCRFVFKKTYNLPVLKELIVKKALKLNILFDINDWFDEIVEFIKVEQPRTYFRPQKKHLIFNCTCSPTSQSLHTSG